MRLSDVEYYYLIGHSIVQYTGFDEKDEVLCLLTGYWAVVETLQYK